MEVLLSQSAPYRFPFFEMYGKKFRKTEAVFRHWKQILLKFADQGKLDIWMPNLWKRTFLGGKSRIFHEALDETQGLVLRCLSAYFDRGIRQIELPHTQEGLLAFFFIYFKCAPPLARSWRKQLSKNIEFYRSRYGAQGASDVLLDVLMAVGIPAKEWKHYLFSIVYRFKGWAALILATADKESPVFTEFVAMLSLCELSKIQDNYHGRLEKMVEVGKKLPACQPIQKIYENNLRGIIRHLLSKQSSARDLLQIKEEELFQLFEVCLTFHNFFKRKLYQRALDQKSNRDFLIAVAMRQKNPQDEKKVPQPKFIALGCIDEREESFRRHLEECEPQAQTQATAGHFGLNIEFQAYRRTHYQKLCPAPQTPFVRVKEVSSSKVDPTLDKLGQVIFWLERALFHPVYGALVTLVVSPILSFGFLVRVFFPIPYKALKQRGIQKLFTNQWKSQLVLEFQTPEDESKLVKAMAETLIMGGLKRIEVPYVFIVGHGSTSLNNPHEAAHDCGACAGGRGWPNARLFAELANRSHVRALLETFGVTMKPHSRFIGAYHNTSSDDVEFMDLPEPLPQALQDILTIFKLAGQKNAIERNRRFLDDKILKNRDRAKSSIVRRSLALDQVRPEYGHATNAYLVIGPRPLTRGLFMDRRSFLCSYHFHDDPEGLYLKNILKTVAPVCIGINLEYYFSWVDKEGYGCGTKIPHNINGLNGVMNGYMSDLLLGLPLQMTEIHRPVRLKVLVAAPVSWVQNVLKELPEIHHEVEHEWFYLSVLDPETKQLFSWSQGGFQEVRIPEVRFPTYDYSLEYIQGSRDFLGFALRKEEACV